MFYEIHTENRLAGYFPGTAKMKRRNIKREPNTAVQDIYPESYGPSYFGKAWIVNRF